METGITKQLIISELGRSAHGALPDYSKVGLRAALSDPEFFAHFIAWNQIKGQIRDSKVALPVIALRPSTHEEFVDNALAHIAELDPRNLVRAYRFAKEVKVNPHGRKLLHLVEQYLRAREAAPRWFTSTALQHRASLKELYALCHIKPGAFADSVLFKGAKVGVFKTVAELKDMAPADAAAAIIDNRLPFLVAINALGARSKDKAVVLALIERMSAAELQTNTKMLQRMGIETVPELRAAYEAGLKKVVESNTVATFKTTRAASALGDSKLAEKLHGAQERQIQKAAGIDGNWLVLADKSGSMQDAIEASRILASTLAKMVKGNVHLVFFDSAPRYINATGKDYDALLAETRHVSANGGTAIGCGLYYAIDKRLDIDGVAIVSDGADHGSPTFGQVYAAMVKVTEKPIPVYHYNLPGEPDVLALQMRQVGHDLQQFDLRHGKVDYYSLPNIVQTMRAGRYSLVDEIMETPLKRVADVFKSAAVAA